MILNEGEYVVTKDKAKNIDKALRKFKATAHEQNDIDLRGSQIQVESMKGLLGGLRHELEEYDRLKTGDFTWNTNTSFDKLAEGLIKTRISKRISQRALAQRLDLEEQQIQHFEEERYTTASYEQMCQIAQALDVRGIDEIPFRLEPESFAKLLAKVSKVGFTKEFVVNRLLSTKDAAVADGEVSVKNREAMLTLNAAAVMERVFGWPLVEILGNKPLTAPLSLKASATERFKVPKSRKEGELSLFAVYANYLAQVARLGIRDHPIEVVPSEPEEMRRRILAQGQRVIGLRETLHTAWDLGVVVLPLKGRGAFHGACWRYEGRNVIVLKQSVKQEARWTFDLLHELYHAAQKPEQNTFEIVKKDATSEERMDSQEELNAHQFAGDVLLKGKADELAKECLSQAQHKLPRLKSVVPIVAERHGLDVGALANYLAFRLSQQGEDWWGTASNLQPQSDPWKVARDVFFERYSYRVQDETDRSLLDHALH